jgi:hypothetical protein
MQVGGPPRRAIGVVLCAVALVVGAIAHDDPAAARTEPQQVSLLLEPVDLVLGGLGARTDDE